MSKKTLINLILALAMLLTLGVGAVSSAPPAQEEMTYTVEPGDNLWTLAEKYLGSGPAYRAIVDATNAKHEGDPTFAHIENPRLIYPGWKILIPGAVAAPTVEALDEQLQAMLEAAVASPDTNWPGAVLHVSSPDLGTWTGAAGLGNIETNTAMRPHDKFRAGSLTKPFIAVVTLQLVEEGLFSLDDTLPTVLPESITDKFADSDKMTVRMLLNHTAGLPDFMDLAGPEFIANPAKIWKAEEFLDFAAAQEPWFAPGEAQGYSNTDYILLGMVIEEATGRSWREEMRERAFEPLNLENTLLPEPDDTTIPGDHARGYADFGGGLVDATEMVNASVVGAPGGQSLVTTPEDLARFMTAVLDGELFQKAATLDEMLTWVDWPDGNPLSPYVVSYGLGLMTADFGSGIEGIGHSGDTPGGYHAFVFHLPDQDITISGAVNAYDYQAGFLLIPRALEILVPGYTAPEPEVASTPPITDAEGNVIPGSIASIETVTLGDVQQTITIRGADTTKPVLLFLHGGPGTPSSPWATWNNVHADLEANFVFVHWDQRGAGKSYSEDLTVDDMHLDNFVSDTLELTDILRERFDQDKIFLWGHSWGSGVGFETLRVNSEPYYAFIASAVRPDWNSTQEMGYEKVLEIARQANDTEAIQALESIQPFDPANPDHVGVRGQFLSQYLVGDFHTEGLEEAWLNYVLDGKSPEYPSAYIEQTVAGMNFTRQTTGLEVLTSGYDHARDFPVSTIPLFFLHGRYDYECPGELAEEYYNFLEAPAKSFTWFEDSAHDVMYDEPDRFNQEMIRIANEILNP
jgi:D-alanyl-D-alanine carboxypeptidase